MSHKLISTITFIILYLLIEFKITYKTKDKENSKSFIITSILILLFIINCIFINSIIIGE